MKYIGYLCGVFSLKDNAFVSAGRLGSDWKPSEYSKETICGYEQYYFPDFVHFCFGGCSKEDNTVGRYSLKTEGEFHVSVGCREKVRSVGVRTPEILLFLFPFKMAQFAIRIELDTDNDDDITAAVAVMRNINRCKNGGLEEYCETALSPIVEAFRSMNMESPAEDAKFDYRRLVENGNKLKIFQIACLGKDRWSSDNVDQLLFEIGTTAPIGSSDGKSVDSPSETFFKEMMSRDTLSVYNNWKALFLFDTTTIICGDCPEWLLKNWTEDYFGMIYICQLYRRNYLFRLNRRFRFERENVGCLENESVDFERRCCFHNISYNFLPEMFNHRVESSLKTEEEKESLYHMISQEQANREKKAENRMNNLLFFMTCLTMASAIWDTCCLINGIIPFGISIGSEIIGYRLTASILTAIVLLALLIYRIRSKSK